MTDALEEALLRYPPNEPFLNDDGIWDQADDWGFSEAQRQAFLAGVAWAEREADSDE